MPSPSNVSGPDRESLGSSSLPEMVVGAIGSVVGQGPVALHEPRFTSLEMTYLQECIESTMVSSVGPFVGRFESALCDFTGSPHAIAVVNGTEALHVALLLANVQPNDEVLVPALSFIATANAVSFCGAVPHFVDSSPSTLGIDPGALSVWLEEATSQRNGVCVNRMTGRIIRAIVPMHVFGHPSDLDELMEIADTHGLVVVEDAAEGLGSLYRGRHVGTLGQLGVLSFNGNKTVTTGGGGAILTADPTLAARARHMTTTSRIPHAWEFEHDEIGFNFRMPNLNAAVGCAQMAHLPRMLASKRNLHAEYLRAFDGIDGVSVVTEPRGSRSNYWLQAILLDEERAHYRDSILARAGEAGLMARPAWRLIPDQTPYARAPSASLDIARSLQARLINSPSSAYLT